MDQFKDIAPHLSHALLAWALFIALLALALAHEWLLARARRHLCKGVRLILVWTATVTLGCKAASLILYSVSGLWHQVA